MSLRIGAIATLTWIAAVSAIQAESPLPFDVGGPYQLIDQNGNERTEADPDGRLQLLFFGYANCQEICSAALPLMAQTVESVQADGINAVPIMITVDPARDTVEDIGPALTRHHPEFVGLTGDEEALQAAYDAYSIEIEEVFFDPEFGPVYAHGSFIYLLDGEGKLQTLLPPILPPEQLAEIVKKYAETS